jgi:glycogen synthase
MLGWEFPPQVSGGLGVACYGLVKALNSMGVDVLFVLPKPAAARTNGKPAEKQLSLPAEPPRLHRPVTKTRAVHAASSADVHHAVEQATAHAAAMQATDQPMPPAPPPAPAPAAARTPPEFLPPAPETGPAVPPVTSAEADAPAQQFQRVTFVPVDAWLAPYMTPAQYRKMVVEEVTIGRPAPGAPEGRWVQRAVSAGAQGPVPQPPNRPPPVRGDTPIHILHAPPPLARPVPAPPPPPPPSPQPPKRDYIDEPATETRINGPANTAYAGDLFSETDRYARLALAVARGEKFSAVHAHDWMTFEAAMAVAAASRKPLIVQIHSTELDRAGVNANGRIMEMERQGMMAADRVIAVSYKTKTQLIEKYGIDPQKIEVVYNATDVPGEAATPEAGAPLRKKQKTVLFLGRLTQQKGPDYFLRAAQKVLSVEPDVKFVVAGKGDMLDELKELAAELGIRKKVVFTGFLKKNPVERAFRAADVYVMPSLSEPFGIAPLEALAHDVPVIISKQSGVAEVLRHVLKVDFWDTEDLANKILAVLRYPPLAQTLRERGHEEVRQLSWDDSARRIAEIYEEVKRVAVVRG